MPVVNDRGEPSPSTGSEPLTPGRRPFLGRSIGLALVVATVAAVGLLGRLPSSATGGARAIPPPAAESPAPGASEVAVLAGGCFWGVQGVFQHVQGVTRAVSGYAGGEEATAHYDMVGSGRTGHAEAVQVTFDPRRISFGRLLQIYFSVAHDPTELNRQGPDVGPQYRSTIFPTTPEQARMARRYIAQLDQARVFKTPIVTTIEPDRRFYPAEAEHQDFMVRNPSHPYIVFHDQPKLDDLRRLFPEAYRAEPALVGTR